MSQGSWAATATTSELVAASTYRASVVVQLQDGDPTWIGIGVAAVVGEGIYLKDAGDSVEIKSPSARKAINGICDTDLSSSGGYQEG